MKNGNKLLSLSSLSTVVLVATFASVPEKALACGDSAYIGEVCLTAATFCPKGTLEASGTILPVNDHAALFSLLGCTYGGDCRSTFALPDLRGRAPVHYGKGTGTGGSDHPFGQYYGKDLIVQTKSQLATHNHGATFTPSGGGSGGGGTASGTITLPVTGSAKIASSSTAATSNTPSDHAVLGVTGGPASKIYSASGTSADSTIGPDGAVTGTASGPVTLDVTGGGSSGGTVSVGAAGASDPMEVVGPRLAMRYCIVDLGAYPLRP